MNCERIIVRCGPSLHQRVTDERKRLLEERGLNLSMSQTATLLLDRALGAAQGQDAGAGGPCDRP